MPVDSSSLWSFDSWVAAYTTIAREHLSELDPGTSDVHAILLEHLNSRSDYLISYRTSNIRDSDDYLLNKVGATLMGSIPFARTWATREIGKDFAFSTLRAFGLGDSDKLQNFQRSFQGAFNSKTRMALGMAATAGEEALKEILQSVAVDGGSEAVHAKPIIGQVISMGMGYHRMRKKMIGILNAAAGKATTIHQGLIIPQVLHLLKSEIAEKKSAGAQVSVIEIGSGDECNSEEYPFPDKPFGWCDVCDEAFAYEGVAFVVRNSSFESPSFCDICVDSDEAKAVKGDLECIVLKKQVLKMSPEESELATWTCKGVTGEGDCVSEEGRRFGCDVVRSECSSCSFLHCWECDVKSGLDKCPGCGVSWTSPSTPLVLVFSKTWYKNASGREFPEDRDAGEITMGELLPPCGYCDACELDFDFDEVRWMFPKDGELKTYHNFCKENLEILEPGSLGVGLTWTDQIATKDMRRWSCLGRQCESRIDGQTSSDVQMACPQCNYTLCMPCIMTQTGSSCPRCSLKYGSMESPLVCIRSGELHRGLRRPLACIMAGKDNKHLEQCKSNNPGAMLRHVMIEHFPPEDREFFECADCDVTYSTSVPFAHCPSADNDDPLEFCYICFFTVVEATAKPCDDDTARSMFILYLPDRPESELAGKTEVVRSPVISIPDEIYPKEDAPLKERAVTFAKEQGTKQFLKHCMVETVNWLTKSHIGPTGAVQLGLMGLSVVPVTYVPWPGLAMPQMTDEDFVWPDVSDSAVDLEFPIPSLDFGYLDDDSFDFGAADGVDDLCTDLGVGVDYDLASSNLDAAPFPADSAVEGLPIVPGYDMASFDTFERPSGMSDMLADLNF
ncbi:hypothetical protein NM208_g2026 [Fusarium decemcellulare]|uniref:Uncharacterized protein n=1 Tax=Fusarium decemcellulare TaxID=57161 RepID=A0ACC1SU49_9HYPO|nr:hypothetical protein NM208_g2026 [Fusarium decemcellulare]